MSGVKETPQQIKPDNAFMFEEEDRSRNQKSEKVDYSKTYNAPLKVGGYSDYVKDLKQTSPQSDNSLIRLEEQMNEERRHSSK